MAINLPILEAAYFCFDIPVPYKLKCGKTLDITPIKLSDYLIFLSSYGILDIDKNNSSNVEDIQMSYLEYLQRRILTNEQTHQQFVNICVLCLGFGMVGFSADERGKPLLVDIAPNGQINMAITPKEFDDIKRIILYQNIVDYDDEYVNPELKQNMAELNAIKMHGYKMPTMERKLAIITAHCGMSKQEQMQMTMRGHSVLFNEVCGEVNFMATKAASLFGDKSDEITWIWQKQKGKYDDYVTSVESYNKSMGGDGVIKPTALNNGGSLDSQYNKFIGG